MRRPVAFPGHIVLTGQTSSGFGTATANLTISFAPTAIGKGTATAAPKLSLTGAATINAIATAKPTIKLVGASTGKGTDSATLTTAFQLSGSSTGKGSATSAIALSLIGASIAKGTDASNLSMKLGVIAATGNGSASVNPTISFKASANGAGTDTGILTVPGGAAVQLTGNASGSGTATMGPLSFAYETGFCPYNGSVVHIVNTVTASQLSQPICILSCGHYCSITDGTWTPHDNGYPTLFTKQTLDAVLSGGFFGIETNSTAIVEAWLLT